MNQSKRQDKTNYFNPMRQEISAYRNKMQERDLLYWNVKD